MTYEKIAIRDEEIPQAAEPLLQHLLITYASETNKVFAVWSSFDEIDLSFAPHAKSSSVLDILKHQLLSERRFFAEFLGSPEVAPGDVVPTDRNPGAFAERLTELARPRLLFLAGG